MQTLTVSAVFEASGTDKDAEFQNAIHWIQSTVTDVVKDSRCVDWTASTVWDGSDFWSADIVVAYPDWGDMSEDDFRRREASLCGQIFWTLYGSVTVHGFKWGVLDPGQGTDQ